MIFTATAQELEDQRMRESRLLPRMTPQSMACSFCRKRKIKCDGVKPTCNSCIDHGRVCEYIAVSAEENAALRMAKRARRARLAAIEILSEPSLQACITRQRALLGMVARAQQESAGGINAMGLIGARELGKAGGAAAVGVRDRSPGDCVLTMPLSAWMDVEQLSKKQKQHSDGYDDDAASGDEFDRTLRRQQEADEEDGHHSSGSSAQQQEQRGRQRAPHRIAEYRRPSVLLSPNEMPEHLRGLGFASGAARSGDSSSSNATSGAAGSESGRAYSFSSSDDVAAKEEPDSPLSISLEDLPPAQNFPENDYASSAAAFAAGLNALVQQPNNNMPMRLPIGVQTLSEDIPRPGSTQLAIRRGRSRAGTLQQKQQQAFGNAGHKRENSNTSSSSAGERPRSLTIHAPPSGFRQTSSSGPSSAVLMGTSSSSSSSATPSLSGSWKAKPYDVAPHGKGRGAGSSSPSLAGAAAANRPRATTMHNLPQSVDQVLAAGQPRSYQHPNVQQQLQMQQMHRQQQQQQQQEQLMAQLLHAHYLALASGQQHSPDLTAALASSGMNNGAAFVPHMDESTTNALFDATTTAFDHHHTVDRIAMDEDPSHQALSSSLPVMVKQEGLDPSFSSLPSIEAPGAPFAALMANGASGTVGGSDSRSHSASGSSYGGSRRGLSKSSSPLAHTAFAALDLVDEPPEQQQQQQSSQQQQMLESQEMLLQTNEMEIRKQRSRMAQQLSAMTLLKQHHGHQQQQQHQQQKQQRTMTFGGPAAAANTQTGVNSNQSNSNANAAEVAAAAAAAFAANMRTHGPTSEQASLSTQLPLQYMSIGEDATSNGSVLPLMHDVHDGGSLGLYLEAASRQGTAASSSSVSPSAGTQLDSSATTPLRREGGTPLQQVPSQQSTTSSMDTIHWTPIPTLSSPSPVAPEPAMTKPVDRNAAMHLGVSNLSASRPFQPQQMATSASSPHQQLMAYSFPQQQRPPSLSQAHLQGSMQGQSINDALLSSPSSFFLNVDSGNIFQQHSGTHHKWDTFQATNIPSN